MSMNEARVATSASAAIVARLVRGGFGQRVSLMCVCVCFFLFSVVFVVGVGVVVVVVLVWSFVCCRCRCLRCFVVKVAVAAILRSFRFPSERPA